MRVSDPSVAPLPDASSCRFAIVVARFNEDITAKLSTGARAALAEARVADDGVELFEVPGAFELPQAARAAADTGRFDAIVCLGCVIRGATPHFQYISDSVAHAMQQAAADTGVPMAFGVLTTDTWEQAEERAIEGRENKGFEAASAAVEMALLFRRLRGGSRR